MEKIFFKSLNIKNRGIYTLKLCLLFILSTMFVSISYAQTNVIDGHEYVDMGLPSGTLWATCNIGAESSTDFGDYFAWGETEPKEEYTNENYKFFEGYKEIPGVAYYMLCTNIGENICGTVYDAARVKWGGRWRLPTYEEIGELVRLCWNKWEEVDGIWGIRFHHGANENTLFLPAAGYADTNQGKTYHFQNWKGVYWTGILEKVKGAPDDHISSAMDLSFGSGGPGRTSSIRTLGYPIRPVINPRETGIDDIAYTRNIYVIYRNGSIELSSIENCDHIDILNVCGQKILSSTVTTKSIETPHFSKGIYICALTKQGKLVCTRRIIVK